ncbi:MAG: Bug family tripartite tricarboxylate transporter substrate binding protein [Burkholderiales bacterium]
MIALSVRSALAVLLSLLSLPTFSQSYPSKQISIIAVLVPGSGLDIIARSYGAKLSQALGRPVIIENKPGGSQIIGVNALMAAPADGHTLLVATSAAMAINRTMFKTLSYDPVKDLIPISLYLKSPFVLVVNPQIPAKTALEFIQYVKERPGKLSYSSPGAAGLPRLSMEIMNARFGLDSVNIPYKDTAQSVADIASGIVQMAFAEAGASQALIKDGRIRALAVSSQTRLSSLPDVPPLAEAVNAPDFEAVSWHVLLTRAGTPPAIISLLHNEMKRIIAEPDIQDRMKGIGLIPVESPSVEGIQKYIADEDVKWGTVVRKLGMAGSQ